MSAKTKQFVVIDINDCDIDIATFEYTEKGYDEAAAYFTKLAQEAGFDMDIDFDSGCHERIAHIILEESSFEVMMRVS